MSKDLIFQSGRLGNLNIKNRFVLAPMTRISGLPTGEVGPLMENYYYAFAKGGFGTIITEGVYTDSLYSQGYKGQPGIITKQQQDSWAPLIKKSQSTGAKVIMQLMHAGALSQYNVYSDITKGPSSFRPLGEEMPFFHGEGQYRQPVEMTKSDIETAINGFVEAAKRAQGAGVDGVEIHGANGYLLDQFLTDYTNLRDDRYGGSVTNRVRLLCEILQRVRIVVGMDFTIGIRISQAKVNNYKHKWAGKEDDAKTIFANLTKAGADYIHTTEHVATDAAFGEGDTLASLARQHSGLPVIANGGLQDVDKSIEILSTGQADFIALGKSAIAAPDIPNRIRDEVEIPQFNYGMLSPLAELKHVNV